jgi:hypothetical protein
VVYFPRLDGKNLRRYLGFYHCTYEVVAPLSPSKNILIMDHFIDLTTAQEMTLRYRDTREAVLAPLYQQLNVLPLSETFERSAIEAVLAQEGCSSLRVYYGMDADYGIHAILVGADASNADLLPSTSLTSETEEPDLILEKGTRCPDICPESSPLNS